MTLQSFLLYPKFSFLVYTNGLKMGELQTEQNGKAEKNGKLMKNGTENYENNGRVGGKGKGKNGNHLYRVSKF